MTDDNETISNLIVAVFRLNGRLIEAGNALVTDIGLTSARWQVLGALAMSPVPLPVAHIARNMGLARQSVQRIADLLVEKELVRFETNPHHQRAKLVVLTDQGLAVYNAATRRQQPWALEMMEGVAPDSIRSALTVLLHMDRHLARADTAGDEL